MVLTFILFGLIGVATVESWRYVNRRRQQASVIEPQVAVVQQPRTISEPEIVLLAPSKLHGYRWIPLQRLLLEQGSHLENDTSGKTWSKPTFRLKNLSDEVITRVRITWKVTDSRPLREVFLNSEYFQQFGPEIVTIGVPRFELRLKDHAMGMIASDEETTDLPFLHPEAKSEGVEVPLPDAFAYGYGLRLAATTARPGLKSSGILQSARAPLDVIITYHQLGKDFTRKFRVESLVRSFSDLAFLGTFSGSVDQKYWLPVNFRAEVVYSVTAID